MHISCIGGHATGKGTDTEYFGIMNSVDFYDFGIPKGVDFNDSGMKNNTHFCDFIKKTKQISNFCGTGQVHYFEKLVFRNAHIFDVWMARPEPKFGQLPPLGPLCKVLFFFLLETFMHLASL